MNFLVTGAAGFLGSALANRLTQNGHTVRGLRCVAAMIRTSTEIGLGLPSRSI